MAYTYIQFPDPNYRAGVQGSSSGDRATVSWHMDAIYMNGGTARYDLQFVEVKINDGDWMRVAGKTDGSYSFTAPYNSTQRACVRGYYKRNIAVAGQPKYGAVLASYLPEMCTTIRLGSPPPPPAPVAPTCPAATSLTVTLSGTTAVLKWVSAATTFVIERDDEYLNTVGGPSGTAWSYNDPGRVEGRTYTYTVRPFVMYQGDRFFCPEATRSISVPRTTPPPVQPPAPSCPAVTGITIRDSGTSLIIDWTGSAPNFEIWRDGSKLTDVGPGRGGVSYGSTWKYQVFPIEFAQPGYYETWGFLDEPWSSAPMPYGHVHPGVRTTTGNTAQDTAVWARRKIPAGAPSYSVTVKVDDEARIFWNGIQIGFMPSTNRDPGQTFTVPANAIAAQRGGEHLLAIRQADTRTELVGPKFSASYLDVQVQPDWSSYTDPNRTPGRFYCYRVRPYVIFNGARYYCPEMGICGRVPSPTVPPEEPPAPPPPPAPPSVTCYPPVDAPLLRGSLTEVEIGKWVASLDWAGSDDGYRLYRQEKGGTAELILDRRTGFMQLDDPNRTPCKTYLYWVFPYTVCGDGSIRLGPKSNTVTLAVPCDVPPGSPDPTPTLTAVERGRCQGIVDLAWSSTSATTGYQLERDGEIWKTVGPSVLTTTDTGREKGASHAYRVRGVSSNQYGTTYGQWSEVASVTMADRPDAPSVDLTASQPFGDLRVLLNWTSSNATYFDLLRDGDVILSATTLTSYADEGPVAGESTTWTVRAYSTDTCGVSLPTEDSVTIRGGADTDDGTGDWEPRLHFLRSR